MFGKKFLFALTCAWAASALNADEINIALETDELVTFEVTKEDSFFDIIEALKNQFEIVESNENWLETTKEELRGFEINFLPDETILVKSKKKKPEKEKVARNYFQHLTDAERSNITYILRTLANSSLGTIIGEKGKLKKAGKDVDHVHPLRFLECIFGNDELKICASNIQGKSWVWGEFLDGIIKSMNEEIAKGNVPPEFVIDFANTIHIDVHLIYQSYLEKNWVDMVNILIAQVPKPEGGNKYDW